MPARCCHHKSTQWLERFGTGREPLGMSWSRRVLVLRISGVALLAGVLSWAAPCWSATAASGPGHVAAKPAAARETYDGPPLLLGDGRRKIRSGAYGSLGAAYTRLLGEDSGLASVEGALLLDHRLSLGVMGY